MAHLNVDQLLFTRRQKEFFGKFYLLKKLPIAIVVFKDLNDGPGIRHHVHLKRISEANAGRCLGHQGGGAWPWVPLPTVHALDGCLMPAAAVLQACRCVGERDLSHISVGACRWIEAMTYVEASDTFLLAVFDGCREGLAPADCVLPPRAIHKCYLGARRTTSPHPEPRSAGPMQTARQSRSDPTPVAGIRRKRLRSTLH